MRVRHRGHDRTRPPDWRSRQRRSGSRRRLRGGRRPPDPGKGPPVIIRVLLADDQTLVRGAFAMLVASATDMEVVGEAANGQEAVALARSSRADVVIMD